MPGGVHPPASAWTRGPFQAAVERCDLSVHASISLNGSIARESITTLSTSRPGAERLSSSRTSKPSAKLDELLEHAREVPARKQNAAGTTLFRAAVAAYPDSAMAWYELAMTQDGRGL